jgi:nuclear pore complex protein Nup98-Nup96
MARFSANITDSSEDEDDLYLNHSQEPPKKPEQSRPPLPPPVEDEEDSDEEPSSSSSSTSEMQEDELITSLRRKRPAQSRNALIEDDDGEIRYAHEVTKRPPNKKSPPRQRGDPTIIPWAQQLGVDAQKMHVMQTSLFRMPEEAAAMKAMNSRAAASAKRLQLPPQSMNRKHSRDSDGDGLRMGPREVCGSSCIFNCNV